MQIGSLGSGRLTFNPLSLGGSSALQLWLDASRITGLNDADAITTWSDASGNGNIAAGTSTSKPLYKTNILNGLPVVRFDGVNDYMTVTRNSGLEPNNATIFALVAGTSSPATNAYMLSKKITSGSVSSYALQHSGSTTPLRGICKVATTGSVNGTTGTLADAVFYNGDARIVVLKMDGTNMRFGFGGQLATTQTASGNLVYDSNDLLIGAYDSTQLYWLGDVGELLFYNSALSAANIGKVCAYLMDKWGALS